MNDIGFTGWEVPPGFTTFEIVEPIQGPVLGTDGTVSYGARDHCYGVGHTAHLPHGGRLTVTPGDRNSYTAAGYYLAAYDALDNWVWGQGLPNVHAALSEGRSQMRVAEYLYDTTRIPYVGDDVDGCLRSAQIDQEEADLLDLADPRRAYLHDSAEAWKAQAQRIAGTDQAPADRAAARGARRQSVEEVSSVGHDQDHRVDSRRDHGDDRPVLRLVASSHVPRVDWIHNTDLDRLLEGEPEPLL